MRRLLIRLAMAAFLLPGLAFGNKATMDGPMTDANAQTGVAYNGFYNLNLDDHDIDVVALQVLVASSTFSQATFTDGSTSTGSLTVVSFTALSSATATASAVVVSTQGLKNQQIFIAGQTFTEGSDWVLGANTGITACNIAVCINANTVYTSTCTGATSVVGSTAPFGNVYNSYSLTSSSPAAFTAGTFKGGQDNQSVTINGVRLVANTDWFPLTSNTATGTSLASAINANTATIGAKATSDTGIVTSTSTAVGAASNFGVVSSSSGALLPNGTVTLSGSQGTASMTGGKNAAYGIGTTNITITNHGLPKALPVWINNVSAVSLLFSSATVGTKNTLATGTTVYVIPVDANTLQLATSSTMAVAGLPMVLASSRALTSTDTWTLNTPPIAGTPSLGLWVGNDGSAFTQILSSWTVSSYVNPSSSTFIDPGTIDYKWLQLRVVPPTSGALSVKALLHGERR